MEQEEAAVWKAGEGAVAVVRKRAAAVRIYSSTLGIREGLRGVDGGDPRLPHTGHVVSIRTVAWEARGCGIR